MKQCTSNAVVNESSSDCNPYTSKFTADRKRRNVLYYVGNIDRYITEDDIYRFYKDNNRHVTFIRLYAGRLGSSAMMMIFWPEDITYRKWKPKEEDEAERAACRSARRQRSAPVDHSPDRTDNHWHMDFTAARDDDSRTDQRTRPSYTTYGDNSCDRTDDHRHQGFTAARDNDNKRDKRTRPSYTAYNNDDIAGYGPRGNKRSYNSYRSHNRRFTITGGIRMLVTTLMLTRLLYYCLTSAYLNPSL